VGFGLSTLDVADPVARGEEITRRDAVSSFFLLHAGASAANTRATASRRLVRPDMVCVVIPQEEHMDKPTAEKRRLTDTQALGLLGAWLVFRAITQRIGLGVGPKLLDSKPWAIPLLNNSSILLIQAGTGTSGRPGMLAATVLASVFMSTVAGAILYWAGWRFGHKLAEMAQRPGSPWAGVWNPKQIARAERWMDRWGMPVVFVARIVEYFTLPVALVAGASEMRFRRFMIANTAGSFAFAGIFLWVGQVAQRRWPWLKDWISNTYGPWALRIGLGLLVLLVILMLLGQRFGKEKTEETEATPAPKAD
jgi:membrane protein DedA with SNARE-associated domain